MPKDYSLISLFPCNGIRKHLCVYIYILIYMVLLELGTPYAQ